MAEKVKERKREEKDTVFLYGGQTWTSDKVTSIDGRAKRQRFDGDIMGKRPTQYLQAYLI